MFISKLHPSKNLLKGQMRTVRHICGTCWRTDKNQFKHPESSPACRTKCDYPVAFQNVMSMPAPQSSSSKFSVRQTMLLPSYNLNSDSFFQDSHHCQFISIIQNRQTFADTIATYPESTGIAHVIYHNVETYETKSNFYSDEHYISIHNEICRS